MKTIRLNRRDHVLYVGDCSKDIDDWNNITMIYNVTHILNCGSND